MRGTPNARFWVWHGGWVKLTLKPGQELSAVQGGPTDEGWRYEATTWSHIGDQVVMCWEENGADCDGRYDRGGECACPLAELRARTLDGSAAGPGDAGVLVPCWEKTGHGWQRDHAAEAAGY